MTAAERVREAFHRILESPPDQRSDVLDGLPGLDDAMRQEVRQLVTAFEQLGSAFETTPDPHSTSNTSEFSVGSTTRVGTAVLDAVGPYRIIRALGQGGQGTVYLASRDDDHYQKTVAVKLLDSRSNDDAAVRRFRHERQILASIDHQFIAKLLDGGVTPDGRPYFVMEYVDGLPITEYCDQHRLSVGERVTLFRDVCVAVHTAHQNLIVHRDLKPGNVLVSKDGTLKLVDFGIAKPLKPENLSLTETVTQFGRQPLTPEYASPEQVRGGVITTASDVYSLGVVLYELLTGSRPYRLKSREFIDVAQVVCEGEPTRPSAAIDGGNDDARLRSTARNTSPDRLRRQLRGDLDNIVLMALRKQPERRYVSAEQLADDLARYQTGLPVRARPDTVAYRARKFVSRNRVAVAAAATVVFMLATTASILAYQTRIVGLERDQAQQARDQAQREASKANAISRFLRDTLSSPNPTAGIGRDVTVLSVLERTTDTLETSFASEPETLAAARSTVGMTYLRLGRFDTAEPLLRQALETRSRLLGDAHVDVAESHVQLATLLMERGKYDEAEKQGRLSLEVARRIGSAEESIAADAHKVLGSVAFWRADYAQADTAYSEALRIRRRYAAEHPTGVAEALNDVAIARRRGGKYQDAEGFLREAVNIYEQNGKPSAPALGTTLNNLTILLDATGRAAEAEPFARQALEIRRRALGDDHPDVGGSLQTLSLVVERQGKLAEAETLIRQALDIQRRAFGEHEWVSHMLRNLGALLSSQGKYPEAEKYLRESLAMRRKLFGNDSADVADSLHQLGRVRRRTGDTAAAEQFLREALAIRRKVLNPTHPETADNLTVLAVVLEERGDRRGAETAFVECLDILKRADPYQRLPEVQLYYGRSLLKWGQSSKAAGFLGSSLEGLKSARGPQHSLTMEAVSLLETAQQQSSSATKR